MGTAATDTPPAVPLAQREVALVLPSFGSGGAERVVLNLARGLAASGRSVRLVVLDATGPLRDLVPGAVEVVDLRQARARSAVPALVAHLRRRPAALVLGSQTHVNTLLSVVGPLLPKATRLVLREPTLHPPGATPAAADRLLGRLLGRADLVVASSLAMQSHLTATIRGRARILHLPNPVDVEGIRAGAAVTLPVAPPGDSGLRLVTVGRLTEGKAHDELLRALARTDTDATLTVIGDGPLRAPLETLSRELDLVSRVRFLGRVDDPALLAGEVAAADLLVHPSRFEGMPNAVLESLALGTPVLATTDLTVLEELAGEVGTAALRLVPRAELPAALSWTPTRPSGGSLRPSLLPERFDVPSVVQILLAALEDPRSRTGA